MDDRLTGWTHGFVGVLIFSGSLPATRVAVAQLDPLFLTAARAAIAGLLGGALLLVLNLHMRWNPVSLRRLRRGEAFGRQAPGLPSGAEILSLVVVALGVVVGFPLLTALALRSITSAHAIVFIGLLPLATAVFGVLRGGERPKPAFWLFSIAGSAAVAGFALAQGGGGAGIGDALMLAAILVCGLGYAEGARLSRRRSGWQVISWALVIALPLMLPLAMVLEPPAWSSVGWPALAALAYVSLFSMLIGFVFWYRGLALGGIAAVGQLQLLQPFLGLALAALLLHEPVGWAIWAVAAAVVVCVACAKRWG
ncbi:DMT family transporter [Labrys wisconsinensis]|uniref:Drug/metabolite transporter (DMT)-like permease n=1 Tax=Labrys wisconsinensis TaxID=425677 RepID=A0ABU0JAM7_9HYPH|nr:DMT family transporter [Labrys wisconsinensis]MDQ0471318.1 drug/metabolite transporter (DMT)-like permease [Labrys wisconsinensis]